MLILRMTLLLVLFVLLVNALFGRPWLESFLFALALAVGLTPELLPMVMSVTLARGAGRMAQRQVVVRRLSAIEDLGSMDVLCTDKTGTLTEAKIRLERHEDARGRESERVLRLAYINSAFETGLRSPLDDAILAHTHIDVSGLQKIDEVPFDFERRRISVLADDGAARLLVVKGAPEEILRLSVDFEDDVVRAPLDAAARARLQQRLDALGDEGFRVLGVAVKEVARDHPHAVVDDETGLTFCGFAAFLDPPKESAREALRMLAADGIALKIVTGDGEQVTRHVCRMLGIEVQRRAQRGADRAAGRRRPAGGGRGCQPFLPGESAAEEPHHPGAESARTGRRLSWGRRQRRPAAAFRRRRPVGGYRSRRGAGDGRHDPARPRPEGRARGRASRDGALSATS